MSQQNIEVVSTDYEICMDTGGILYIEAKMDTGRKWHVQVDDDGQYRSESGCLIYVDSEEYEGDGFEDESALAIAEAEKVAADVIKDRQIDAIKDSDDGEEIQEKAQQVADILGEGDSEQYLILAAAYHRSDSLDIGNEMIRLQVALECTQDQSRQVVDLFID